MYKINLFSTFFRTEICPDIIAGILQCRQDLCGKFHHPRTAVFKSVGGEGHNKFPLTVSSIEYLHGSADGGFVVIYKDDVCISHILKIKFQEETQATTTKEGTISWGTPTLNGRAAALDVDGSGKLRFQLHKTFSGSGALADAKSYLNGFLHVS